MLWQDRSPFYDVGVTLGLLLAVVAVAPAYLVVAAVRRVAAAAAASMHPAWRGRLDLNGAGRLVVSRPLT